MKKINFKQLLQVHQNQTKLTTQEVWDFLPNCECEKICSCKKWNKWDIKHGEKYCPWCSGKIKVK